MASSSTKVQVALLGSETLFGRELKEVVEGRGSAKVLSYAAEGDEKVEATEGETVPLQALSAKSLAEVSAVLLGGSPASANETYDLATARAGSPVLVDCLGYLESRPESRILAPLVAEPDLQDHWLITVAHPVASALVLTLTRLTRLRALRSAVANVFEPASERGKPGVSELHQQTTALLTFKTLNKTVFDTQVSFNLLPRVGEDAAAQLIATEARIDRHVATLLSQHATPGAIPMPSIRLMQAPVFHGYSLSLWVEFESEVQPLQIEEALASAQVEIRRNDEEPPDNVGAASQSGLIAGDIRIDRNNPRAAWIWIVMDNLRIVADASADILRHLPVRPAVKSPSGKTGS